MAPDLATTPSPRGRLATLRPFRADDVEVMAGVPRTPRCAGSAAASSRPPREAEVISLRWITVEVFEFDPRG